MFTALALVAVCAQQPASGRPPDPTVTAQDLRVASQLIGLDLTDREIGLMLRGASISAPLPVLAVRDTLLRHHTNGLRGAGAADAVRSAAMELYRTRRRTGDGAHVRARGSSPVK